MKNQKNFLDFIDKSEQKFCVKYTLHANYAPKNNDVTLFMTSNGDTPLGCPYKVDFASVDCITFFSEKVAYIATPQGIFRVS